MRKELEHYNCKSTFKLIIKFAMQTFRLTQVKLKHNFHVDKQRLFNMSYARKICIYMGSQKKKI